MSNRTLLLFCTITAATVLVPTIRTQTLVRGTVTYIAGDAVYTSVGKTAGIVDSTLLYIVARPDTVAILKVFGTSSRSSVGRIISATRPPVIGDSVFAHAVISTQDSSRGTRALETIPRSTKPEKSLRDHIARPLPSFVEVHGRMGIQYLTTIQPVRAFTQPGVVLNIRGTAPGTPISFEVYGNIRTLIYNSQSPFSPHNKNQTRIYRLSFSYEEPTYGLSLGRIIPTFAPSVGYVDGMMATKRLGNWVVGGIVGFEPNFSQRTVSTDSRKIGVFSNFTSKDIIQASLSLSYARTYVHSLLDREVVGMLIYGTPFDDCSMSLQSEIDLRSKVEQRYTLHPHLTNLFASANYRFSPFISAGLGFGAFRPSYAFSSVRTVPDSLLDNTMNSSINASVNLYLPGRIIISNTLSPRSSEDGFGKEYSNYTSIAVTNLLNEGFTIRGAMTVSATLLTRIHGYAGYIQKTLVGHLDIAARFQTTTNRMLQFNEKASVNTIGLDVISFLVRELTVWLSLERTYGTDTNGYNVFTELSWRF